jgi:uncharacterized surface protein with fasciclin (FAS1) repeats
MDLPRPQDIVDVAVGAGTFKTLATALGVAGLVDTLKGPVRYPLRLPRYLSRNRRLCRNRRISPVTDGSADGVCGFAPSQGPFTVFAPTDDAFAKIPKPTLDAILANKKLLTSILLYHVVSGKVMAADVVKVRTQGGAGGDADWGDGDGDDASSAVKRSVRSLRHAGR